jgi:hypothetical protein
MWSKSNRIIFMDESGDLGPYGSPYFTIVFVDTLLPELLERIVKKTRDRVLERKMNEITELKANKSSPRVRKYILQQISELPDLEIHYIAIEKKKILPHLYNAKNRLYNYIAGLLAKKIPMPESIEVLIDKKDTNQLLRDDFDKYLTKKIHETNPATQIHIKHLPSQNHKGLQAIDYIAWAINRKYSFGQDDYYDLIKNKIRTQER